MGKNALFLKIDFGEAYAIIDWDFIIDMLNCFDLTDFFCEVTNIAKESQTHKGKEKCKHSKEIVANVHVVHYILY